MARMTRDEHLRMQRRRSRQFIGLLVVLLVLVGLSTVIGWGTRGVAALLDDSGERAEYEQRLSGLVMLDPLPFDDPTQADPTQFKEAAIWGIVYAETAKGTIDQYERDADTDCIIIPALQVNAYIAQLLGPDYQVKTGTFECNDMTYLYNEEKAGYLVPVTGQVAMYTPKVEKLEKRNGRQVVTVGYVPTITNDLTLTAPTEPVRYMEYVFDRGANRVWYLSALQGSSMKPAVTAPVETDLPEIDLNYNPTESLQEALEGDSSIIEDAVDAEDPNGAGENEEGTEEGSEENTDEGGEEDEPEDKDSEDDKKE